MYHFCGIQALSLGQLKPVQTITPYLDILLTVHLSIIYSLFPT